jgi:hypothetical protein
MPKKSIIVNKWDTVLIKWIDAVGSSGWKDAETYITEKYEVDTIGMFVGENDIYWVICSNHGYTNSDISNITSIPKGMITHVEVLKRAF